MKRKGHGVVLKGRNQRAKLLQPLFVVAVPADHTTGLIGLKILLGKLDRQGNVDALLRIQKFFGAYRVVSGGGKNGIDDVCFTGVVFADKNQCVFQFGDLQIANGLKILYSDIAYLHTLPLISARVSSFFIVCSGGTFGAFPSVTFSAADGISKMTEGLAETVVGSVRICQQTGILQMEGSFLIHILLGNVNGSHVSHKNMMGAKFKNLAYFAFDVDRCFRNQRTFHGVSRNRQIGRAYV